MTTAVINSWLFFFNKAEVQLVFLIQEKEQNKKATPKSVWSIETQQGEILPESFLAHFKEKNFQTATYIVPDALEHGGLPDHLTM